MVRPSTDPASPYRTPNVSKACTADMPPRMASRTRFSA
jgi:hypothetical protein